MPAALPSSTLEKFTTFGDLLWFLRRRIGSTQLELALAVGYSGTQISRLEQNLRLPDIATLEARFVSTLELEAQREYDAQNFIRFDVPFCNGLLPMRRRNALLCRRGALVPHADDELASA